MPCCSQLLTEPAIDAILRSLLYAHFAESLSGLPTIRSYGEVHRFLSDNEYYIDLEDRANYIVVTNQRWLAIRLDFLGGLMVFVVSKMFGSRKTNISTSPLSPDRSPCLPLQVSMELTQLKLVLY